LSGDPNLSRLVERAMTVRDVYIFEDLGRVSRNVDYDDYDDPEAEILDDARYARRVRRAPLLTERSVRRVARERRDAAITEREIEDDVAETRVDDAILTRSAFGGVSNLGAALAVIGLLILVAAWSGPSWGWGGGSISQGGDAYGFDEGRRGAYTGDFGYPDRFDARYARSGFEGNAGSFIDPSHSMYAGGTLLLVGILLLATRRRGSLLG